MSDKGTQDLYERVDDTTWPVNVGQTEWQLRYGDVDRVRFHAASVAAAYGHLTNPAITQAHAIEALKRARKAMTGSLPGRVCVTDGTE